MNPGYESGVGHAHQRRAVAIAFRILSMHGGPGGFFYDGVPLHGNPAWNVGEDSYGAGCETWLARNYRTLELRMVDVVGCCPRNLVSSSGSANVGGYGEHGVT